MTELEDMSHLPFGERLAKVMDHYGPLCVGIDPHRALLKEWGYEVDAEGAELFGMRMLQAARGRAGVVKYQIPMFARFGSQGFAALERLLYAAKRMGLITIIDAMCGGLSTTVSAYADAYLKEGSPLEADAVTLLPYYGFRSLRGFIEDALKNNKGVFCASLTSNEEGINLQTAIRQYGEFDGRSVACGVAGQAQKYNEDVDGMGSVGLIIGANVTKWIGASGVSPAEFTGPILAPGYGWQGGKAEDLKTVFAGTHGNVLVTVARAIATKGPDIPTLGAQIDVIQADIKAALAEAQTCTFDPNPEGVQPIAPDDMELAARQAAAEAVGIPGLAKHVESATAITGVAGTNRGIEDTVGADGVHIDDACVPDDASGAGVAGGATVGADAAGSASTADSADSASDTSKGETK